MQNNRVKTVSLAIVLFSAFLLSTQVGVQLFRNASAATAYTEYNVTFGAANCTIRIPSPIESWNRDLVLFCRGYDHNMPSDAMRGSLGTWENWATAVLATGAAFAATTYGSGGYCVQKGMETTHQLALYVKSTFNATGKTYLMGVSMGGNIALMLGQKYPNVYSGVLDVCGAKNTTDLYNGGIFMSTANDSQMDQRLQSFTAPMPPYPFSLFGSGWRSIYRSWCAQVAADMEVECGGTPSAVPQVYRDIDPLYHANISIPVITVHGTSDALVPFSRTLEYQAAVNAAGKTALYRLYPISGGQHADAAVVNAALSRLTELMAWSNTLTGSDWPMFRNNLQHTGYSASPAPNTNQTLWTYTTGMSVYSSPAVVDGMVYIGSYDKKVYALYTADGAFKWSYTTGGAVESSPTVVNGVVYVGSDDNKTYALNAASGNLLWSYSTGGYVTSSPAVVGGIVYVGSLDKKVYALNATDGFSIWNYTTGDQVASSPAIFDGRLYVASNDFKVYCINASTGALIWNYATYNSVTSSPAVADGRVYVGSYDASVYCLNASTGVRIWQYADVGIVSSPAVANGKVYIGQGGLYPRTSILALNATTGVSIWNFTTGASVASSPAIADGKIYVGSPDMKIYALNESTGALIWSYRTGSSVRSSPAVSEGTLYVGSDDGKVYAFGSAPPTITLSQTAQAPGASVSIVGTGFNATKVVAIGFGAERSANDSNIVYSGSGVGPWTGRVSNYPIKPRSFLLTSVVVGIGGVANHTDNGDGTLSSPSQFFASGTINYVTGQWSTIATMDISMFDRVYNATYTRYQYNLTSASGITTNSTGGFTALIAIPWGLANGNYDVTAIDASGNLAVATLNVNSAIPEGLPFGAAMLLASAAVAAGSWQLRKRPRILK